MSEDAKGYAAAIEILGLGKDQGDEIAPWMDGTSRSSDAGRMRSDQPVLPSGGAALAADNAALAGLLDALGRHSVVRTWPSKKSSPRCG